MTWAPPTASRSTASCRGAAGTTSDDPIAAGPSAVDRRTAATAAYALGSCHYVRQVIRDGDFANGVLY